MKNDEDRHQSQVYCCFCQQTPAVVAVRTVQPLHPRTRTTTTVTSAYCYLHYYTTSAVRAPIDMCVIIDNVAAEQQKPAVQKLFAEAFVQLQQELSETAARALDNKKDPLAVLHHIHKKAQRKKPPPPSAPPREPTGGFLREIAPPARLVKTQQQQARKQQALLKRMERAATSAIQPLDVGRPAVDISKRRKSSRKSIWNTVLDNNNNNNSHDDENNNDATTNNPNSANNTTTAAMIHAEAEMHTNATCSSCGSDQVKVLASHTSRDVRKGEIWGSGRESSARVECLVCGKTWNEEE